jgi:ribosome-associated protein
MATDLEQIKIIAKALDAKKGGDIIVLDLREQSSYLNYFVLVTGLSRAHLKTLFDEVHKTAVENGIERPRSQSPQFESGWVTYDLGFYVIHLFEDEKRKFYNLEGIWKGAPRISLAEESSHTSESKKAIGQDVLGREPKAIAPQSPGSSRAERKIVSKKTKKSAVKPESFTKKKTTIKKKTIKEKKMATAKKKPAAKKKAAKKPAKKKAAKKK